MSFSTPTASQPLTHKVLYSARQCLGFAALIWLLTGLCSAFMPLVADEMYYVQWSHQLDFGYFDHPPMVAYWIWLFGHHPRIAAWTISLGSIVMLTLAARASGSRHWYYSPLLFVSTPLGLSAGLFMTPDIPLLLGWSIVIYGLVTTTPRLAWLGLTIGLLSKPTALLMLPAIALRFGWRQSLWVVGGALAMCAPMLEWSASHEWLPYSFQSARGFVLGLKSPLYVLEALAVQALVVGPIMCWSLWGLLFKNETRSEGLWWMCGPIIAASLLTSLGMHLEANWPMMLWPPIVVFAPSLSQRFTGNQLRWQCAHSLLTLSLLIALPIVLHVLPASVGPDRDGQRLARCLESKFPGARRLAVRYQEMALLSDQSPKPYLLVAPSQRRSQYNLWHNRLVSKAHNGDIVLHLAGQCPGVEKTYDGCAIKAYKCTTPTP